MTKRYDDLPRALKGGIRLMAGVVHERLLAVELRKLDGEFGRWFNTNDVRVLGLFVMEALGDGRLRGFLGVK